MPQPRRIVWNFESSDQPERHHVIALIINSSREIQRIKQRIRERMQPIIEEQIRSKGKAIRLKYELISFDTTNQPTSTDLSEAYEGEIKRNRDLYERNSSDGLRDYVESHIRDLAS